MKTRISLQDLFGFTHDSEVARWLGEVMGGAIRKSPVL